MKKDAAGLSLKMADAWLQVCFILYCLLQVLLGDGDGYVTFYLGLFAWQGVSLVYWKKNPAREHEKKMRLFSGVIMFSILLLLIFMMVFSMLEPRSTFQIFPESPAVLALFGACVIIIPPSIFFYLYILFRELRKMEARGKKS